MASAGNSLIFKDSEEARDAITVSQKKQIAKLYDDWSNDLGERAKYYKNKNTSTSAISERQAKELQKSLSEYSKQISNEIYKGIKQNIYEVADAVVKDNVTWLESLGFPADSLNAAYGSVPDDIVRMLITGQIYEGGWNLSSRIWSDNEKTLETAYQIVAKGMAENRPIYDIAKELEKYVQPGAANKWNPYLLMKNTKTGEWERKRIYKKQVDYNAQRLARTLVQHGYQQSFVAVTKYNPFVLKYLWSANGSRPCKICMTRDGETYSKNGLPMDHPNGQCTMIPVVDEELIDKIADWYNSPDGTYPDIDQFAAKLGYSQKKNNIDLKSLGTSKGKTFNGWYGKLTPEQKEYAKKLKEESGLTWQKWYEKNIYSGNKALATEAAKSAISGVPLPSKTNIAYDKWIDLMEKQTEKSMLDTEKAQFAKMTQAQIDGIVTYSGSSYSEINGYLRYRAQGMSDAEARRRSGIRDSQMKALEDAMEGLRKAALTSDTYLRRGTDLGDLAGLLPGDFRENKNAVEGMKLNELKSKFEGMQGTYAGFTSTSSLYERGFDGDVEVIMHAPAGTEATSIMSISKFGTSEGETLLNAGTRVEIVAIEESDFHKGSGIRVFMEIINK